MLCFLWRNISLSSRLFIAGRLGEQQSPAAQQFIGVKQYSGCHQLFFLMAKCLEENCSHWCLWCSFHWAGSAEAACEWRNTAVCDQSGEQLDRSGRPEGGKQREASATLFTLIWWIHLIPKETLQFDDLLEAAKKILQWAYCNFCECGIVNFPPSLDDTRPFFYILLLCFLLSITTIQYIHYTKRHNVHSPLSSPHQPELTNETLTNTEQCMEQQYNKIH